MFYLPDLHQNSKNIRFNVKPFRLIDIIQIYMFHISKLDVDFRSEIGRPKTQKPLFPSLSKEPLTSYRNRNFKFRLELFQQPTI